MRHRLRHLSHALTAAFVLCSALNGYADAAQFAFAAFGDTPYNPDEEPQLVAMIAQMNHQPLAFALHVGDFKDSRTECSDALFAQRRDTFGLSHHPFIYTPGDNEWTDCRRARWAPHDPLERLDALRQMFFAHDESLGQRRLRVEHQAVRGYPENLRWVVEDVLFATVNIPGPDNNQARMPVESKQRTAAVLEWIIDAFRIARERKLPALVLATQADLFTGNGAYAGILASLARSAERYDGQVLLVHGDTHWFRFDKPLIDPASGRKVDNLTRLEVYGSPFVNWVYVTVNTDGGRARFTATPGSDVSAKSR
ncbi:MAG: hypothetical protein M3154_03510 [Candidatus Eremiobacteraeota bacterium]|nr:hypothetical protein [Candidatus Eremiobacteraeota bacterium]